MSIINAAREQIGWMGAITATRDERVVIVKQGPRIWRTAIDGDGWYVTGPPYLTKLEALAQVNDYQIEMWFG